MPDKRKHQRSHLILKQTSELRPYKAHSSKGGSKPEVPDLPRQKHGKALRKQLQELKPIADLAREFQEQAGLESGLGLQIQFMVIVLFSLAT